MDALLSNRKALFGGAIMVTFLLMALVGPCFVQDPKGFVGLPLQPPSLDHWLGTTGQGQDVLAQTVAGARSSLSIGLIVGFSVVAIGALVGTTAGYFGGWVDDVLSTVINVFLIMPGLPLMVVLAAYLPPGPGSIALVLILTGWSWSARVVRSQALSLRRKDFVAAAQVAGERPLRIIAVEILPNMTSLLVSAFIGATNYAIAAQVGLEFLGLGEVSAVTWGTNLYWATNDAALLTGSWWTFVPTGLAVALVSFSLVLINTALDELGNPRLRSERAFVQALGLRAISPDEPTPVVRRPS
ncbi:putative oligopeptide/dipeptide ABC transporter, permease/ATP-binding protein [Plesiocystis pacifica SIR-1]|uniref:Putative oligopeptide/dipeptide ABC transporter, permease/ATP-binding protein n=1 Tax=Plesiocystis pacifica SIR-1 TaxID=391625 RepID=A6FX43_9BACT|nr:ABC transporter permease [Plesiocystis pacifica]EDM81867.1 putative oligopeptide/dipeptide ABC transporter, permease/ATP-binding protein [Plesiocystis pacifica SIR-1]